MAEKLKYMVTGLGNPGREYSQTRHNMGFLVVDELARREALFFAKSRFDAEMVKGRLANQVVYLVKPTSYMNRSGFPIQKISAYFDISPSQIVVVHDELDLPFGRIMVAKGRGHGGHNGIRSLIDMLGSKDFIRVRVGVGRPQQQSKDVTGHVLGKFSEDERKQLDDLIVECADVCESILRQGLRFAMNSVNSRKK